MRIGVGRGLRVIARDEVGPVVAQFVLVPYTERVPEEAVAPKLTVTELLAGVAWVIVTPVAGE